MWAYRLDLPQQAWEEEKDAKGNFIHYFLESTDSVHA